MGNKGWIKRVLPFFATFAVGIFIASFFVSVGPRWGRHGRWKMRAEMERLRTENEELKNENLRLRNECRGHDVNFDMNIPDLDVLPVEEPPTPTFPTYHRPPKRDR
jgi:hypothetical protein